MRKKGAGIHWIVKVGITYPNRVISAQCHEKTYLFYMVGISYECESFENSRKNVSIKLFS